VRRWSRWDSPTGACCGWPRRSPRRRCVDWSALWKGDAHGSRRGAGLSGDGANGHAQGHERVGDARPGGSQTGPVRRPSLRFPWSPRSLGWARLYQYRKVPTCGRHFPVPQTPGGPRPRALASRAWARAVAVATDTRVRSQNFLTLVLLFVRQAPGDGAFRLADQPGGNRHADAGPVGDAVGGHGMAVANPDDAPGGGGVSLRRHARPPSSSRR
jgi:hypothetical protein